MDINEPKRHHYIPRFILKNFNNDDKQVYYWNIKEQKIEQRNIFSVFMNKHMYRDEINHKDNPTEIEKNLAKFEEEVSTLINQKILNNNKIILKRYELEKLRIFFTLISFRSDLRMKQYITKKFDKDTESVLSDFSNNQNYIDLWKREIDELSKVRRYEEIENSKIIDPIIKTDFLNDLEGLYMTIVDARGGEFLISDVYPTLEIFPLYNGVNIHLHMLFPISPNRMIVLNNILFQDSKFINDPYLGPMYRMSKLKGNIIIMPKNKYKYKFKLDRNDEFIYTPQKIYSNDVEYINALILNESRLGVMFKNKDKIFESVRRYNLRDDTKGNYNKFEEELKKVIFIIF